MQEILIVVQCIIVLLLVAVIFLQKSSADSLSGLSGGGHNTFGHKSSGSSDIFSKAAIVLTTLFLINSLILAKIEISQKQTSSGIVNQLRSEGLNSPPTRSHAPAAE